ncbi:VOC family protein [Pseudonocardia sp.]|nr:VOC family protein [Pseudonocardia sp.]
MDPAPSTATVVRKPGDTAYGSRQFVVRDPEGHTWSAGTWYE